MNSTKIQELPQCPQQDVRVTEAKCVVSVNYESGATIVIT
jgi:hypothetical protein